MYSDILYFLPASNVGYWLFRYKVVSIQVVLIQVFSFKSFDVLGLKNEDIHSKCFSCSLANYT